MRCLALVVLALVAGCPSGRLAPLRPRPLTPGEAVAPAPGAPILAWARVETAADMPPAPPPGTYRVHLIDVGTGLSVLVQGADFALLYDAGTNDAGEKPRRVLAYLAAALGASGDGDPDCVDVDAEAPVERRLIENVVLSHPHLDHASALNEVLHCYDVGTFWDAGAVNQAKFYSDLLDAIGHTPAMQYRTAADVPATRRVLVKGTTTTIPQWQHFGEGDVVPLGAGAQFTILHANGKTQHDMNQSSIVLAVELGGIRLLLVGDAESGDRKEPSYPPGDVEEYLIERHAAAIRAHILQVGHHGSITSSRRGFLAAVQPALALVSAGPKRYGKVTLPDREVIEELAALNATILRTDERDASCPVRGRIGGDVGPGGCDSWVITISPPVGPAPVETDAISGAGVVQ